MRVARSFGPCIAALLASTGCLERHERFVVGRDASVAASIAVRADSAEELYLGDPLPTEHGGWTVDAWIEKDEEERDVFRLSAERRFPPGTPLPEHYAEPGDPDAEVVLRFPTRLDVEERPDGTYYHFRRTYLARPWAQLEVERQRIEKEVGRLDRDRLAQLGPAEQRLVIDGLARSESARLTHFARLAFVATTPEAPQDAWLSVLEAARRAAAEIDHARLVRLLLEVETDPEAATALERQQADLEERVVAAMHGVLRDSGAYSPGQLNRFIHLFHEEQRRHEITHDLSDERFTVRVEMPGTIVGHNADGANGNVVTWTFEGTMLRDRDVDLMVTSRVD